MKTAIIIGAGPAGLTAAYELLEKTNIQPIIFEATGNIGGISQTINCRGNRIDIGGHRFFSKSDKVMDWWFNILPLQGQPARDDRLLDRNVKLSPKTSAPDPEKTDLVMLNRNRLSRIFFLKKFFPYPISLNGETLKNLGVVRIMRIGWSYVKIRLAPIRPEKSLEDFYINRFGRELYRIFFKDYTEKLWGVPCDRIRSDWGAQRVKGLSITKALAHALKRIFAGKGKAMDAKVETSLIDNFFYPKFGPGQLWEQVADIIKSKGGQIYLNHEVVGLETEGNKIKSIKVKNQKNNELKSIATDYVLSSMPLKDLIAGIPGAPEEIKAIAAGLQYRDFITVGLLLDKLKINNQTKIKTLNDLIPDTWIYIQEPEVKMCRVQIFNNWSPYLVKDSAKVWLGLEYVCSENDALWNKNESDLTALAVAEMEKMGIIAAADVVDTAVIRIKKAYPSYIGAYDRLGEIKDYLNGFENLFCIGRNGQHRYNNMDHSMLTAMTAVANIHSGQKNKDNIWNINAESDYHENK